MISKAVDNQRYAELRWGKTRSSDEACEAWVAGCADIVSAPLLAELVAELRDYSSIVLNVSALGVADATFLGFLLRLRDQEHRTIRVIGARAHLKRLLDGTGLACLFS
jgi:hypothetical protein